MKKSKNFVFGILIGASFISISNIFLSDIRSILFFPVYFIIFGLSGLIPYGLLGIFSTLCIRKYLEKKFLPIETLFLFLLFLSVLSGFAAHLLFVLGGGYDFKNYSFSSILFNPVTPTQWIPFLSNLKLSIISMTSGIIITLAIFYKCKNEKL